MTLVPSTSGPQEKSSEDSAPDLECLWAQLIGLSGLMIEFSKEMGDKAPKITTSWMEDIYKGVVDPEKDWNIKLDSLPRRSTLNEKRYEHFLAANRQLCYFERLYNKNRPVELARLTSSERNDVLSHLRVKLTMCIVWGYWHYHVSLSTHTLLQRNSRKRGVKAAHDKVTGRGESVAVLRALVRGRLKNRPHRGWPIQYDTAGLIATALEPLLNEYKIDIPERGDDLVHRIDLMMKDDPSLKRIHKENG